MKKIIWIPLVIIIIGIVLASVGCAAGGMKSVRVGRDGFRIADWGNLEKVDESFSGFKNIEIDADFLDRVELKEGNGYMVRGQNYESWGGLKVELEGDTLIVLAKSKDERFIGLGIDGFFWDNRDDAWLEITYPGKAALGDVDVKLSAGEVRMKSLDCASLMISSSFGNIEVSGVNCDSLDFIAKSGRIDLSYTEAAGNIVIKSDFGDAELVNINADSLSATLNAGDITAENIDAKTFYVKNDFGKIDIDGAEADKMELKLSSGNLKADKVQTRDLTATNSFGDVTLERFEFTGRCEVESDSGDVKISLRMAESDLTYTLDVSVGEIWVQGKKARNSVTNRTDASASLTVDSSFGDIRLNFAD